MNPNNKISQTGNSVLGVVNKTNFYCKGNFNPYREKHLKIMTNSPNPLDKYGDDDILSTILRWSLYFGAFFQLACIMASIFMPSHDKDDVDNLEDSKSGGGDAQPNNRRLHKLRKQEKKKRR